MGILYVYLVKIYIILMSLLGIIYPMGILFAFVLI